MLHGKCPRCREGDMFAHPFSRVQYFASMNKQCPHCGVYLEPEPGFYQGAMYVGYALTLAVIVVVSIILYFIFNNPSEWTYITVIIVIMVLLIPLNYRYSRILFLHLFGGIKFDPSRK